MKAFICLSALVLALSGCAHKTFGVDDAVWEKLSETERKAVIDSHNKREEAELANQQANREKELENERNRLEIERQNAPIYAVADAVSSVIGKSKSEEKKWDRPNRISSLSLDWGFQKIVIQDTKFDVSPFTKMSKAWIKGQKVEITKNNDLMYPVQIKNLDNGETVFVQRK